MLIPVFLSASLLATPVKDTVWWNTFGGKVTEHRDPSGADCSLMFYNDDGSVVFRWDSAGKTSVVAIDWNWEFPNNWQMPVAIQVGNVWLSNGGDSAIIQGSADGNTVSVPVTQPVETLLRPATHIEVRTGGTNLSIGLDRVKVGTLLDHTQQCLDVIMR